MRTRLPRRRTALLAALVLAVWNGAPVAALYLPSSLEPQDGGRTIHLVFANLKADIGIQPAQLEWIVEQDPDLIGFAEVAMDAPPLLDAFLADWSERLVVPEEGNFGIALYSKLPLHDARVVNLAGGVPTLTAEVLLDDGGRDRFRFVVTHPPPPLGQTERHRRHMEKLSRLARDAELPLLVIGDLNATPWSPRFRDLIEVGGLEHARQGRGILPSWSPLRIPMHLLPIDHVLVKGPWEIERFEVHPFGPSDHAMIAAEVRLGTERGS